MCSAVLFSTVCDIASSWCFAAVSIDLSLESDSRCADVASVWGGRTHWESGPRTCFLGPAILCGLEGSEWRVFRR
jgi:hypothetical protein